MIKKEVIIFAIVVSVAFIVFITLMLFSSNAPTQPPSFSPSPVSSGRLPGIQNNLPAIEPFPSPSIAPSPSPVIATTKEDLIYQLPFQSELFNIEYLSVSDLFTITIKENPFDENASKANQWFIDRGFDPDQLNVYYHSFPEVRR